MFKDDPRGHVKLLAGSNLKFDESTPGMALVAVEDGGEEAKVRECEARVRAYMRMLRVGEGTGELVKSYDKKSKSTVYISKNPEEGYTTAFGGNKITNLRTHPEKNYGGSSAAGAYQVMRYTWWGFNGFEVKNKKKTGVYQESKDIAKKYGIKDFSPESQDKFCLVLLKHHPGCHFLINYIIKGKIEKATRQCGSRIWASLPYKGDNSRYKFKGKIQPATSMTNVLAHYEEFYKEELEGRSNLHLKKGFLKEFGYQCCGNKTTNNTKVCNICNKKHIDLSNDDYWMTQPRGQCYKTCVKIINKYGINVKNWKNQILIADQNEKTITQLNFEEGLAYLDDQLEKGNPIIVGVDDGRIKTYNKDNSTEHFIVIIGRECEQGVIFYNYFDVGTRHKPKGTRTTNRLEMISSGEIIGNSPDGKRSFKIVQIRKNKI